MQTSIDLIGNDTADGEGSEMAVASWILEAIGVVLCLAFSVMYSKEKMRAQTYIFSVSLAILLVVIGVLLRS